MRPDTSFTLGDLSVSPSQSCITTGFGEQRVLQTKFIDVLVYLAQNYPRLVSRQELIDEVWNGNAPVGEKALTNAIWHLRQQYKDKEQPLIETVRKRGYRLMVAPQFDSKSNQSPLVGTLPANRRLSFNHTSTAMAVLIVVLSTLVLWQTLTTGQPMPHVSDITAEPGKELFPAPSPDGQKLAYVWERLNQSADLFVKDLTAPKQPTKQLTFDQHQELRPVWSKDGKYLFFVQKQWQNNHCLIIQLELASNTQQFMAECPGNINISLAISPDGQTLAFTGQHQGEDKAGLYLLDLNHPDLAPVRFSCGDECHHRDRDFAFSPDSRYLAVTRRVESLVEDIFLIDRHNQTTEQLTFGAGDIVGLTWHSDGDKILYAAEIAGRRDGYLIDLPNRTTVPLGVPGFSFPQFIGQSSEVVFHHKQDREFLASLDLRESVSTLPSALLQSRFCHTTPHYSDAVKRLAYVSNESGFNEIWTADIDGGNRRQMTELKQNVFYPNWSHDGRYIAFLTPLPTKQGNQLLVLNVKDNTIKKLNSPFTSHKRPTWLRDNSAVIAAISNDEHPGLYAFSIQLAPPKYLLHESIRYAVEIPDDKLLYSGAGGLKVYDFKQQLSSQVLDAESFNVAYNWVVSDEGIYFQSSHQNHDQINFFNFNNQQVKTVVKLPGQLLSHSSSMTYIADNQTLVFNRLQLPQVDIKRLKHPLLD